MAGVIFWYEPNDKDVWSGRNSDLDAWNYACKVGGGMDKAIVINTTDQVLQSFDVSMDVQFVDNLADAIALTTGTMAYLTCPWNPGTQTPITSLDHSTVDWYVLGGANGWTESTDGYFLPQAGIGAVHSVHAFTATMFHRYWSMNSGS